jgi:hypothetical protein
MFSLFFLASLEQYRMIFVPGPLGQIIRNVEDPHPIENVAGWFERIRHLGRMTKIKKRGKGKPHPAPLIGNGSSAPGATDLAGQDALMDRQFAVEEMQVTQSSGEPDVVLVKDGRPLHRGTMQLLACSAVTDLCIHRLGAHLVSNGPAVADRTVSGDEPCIVHGCVFGSKSFFCGEHLQSCWNSL